MSGREDIALLGDLLDPIDPFLPQTQERLLSSSASTSRLNTQTWPAPSPYSAPSTGPQALTSLPIPGSSHNWHWSNGLRPTSLGALFLEPAHLPDFGLSPSPADTSHSLQSAAQRQGSLDAPFLSRNSAPPESPSKTKSFKELHAERNKQAQRRFRKRQKEKIMELQAKLAKVEAEKAELERRRSMLDSACQLRGEELQKVKERQSQAAEAEEDELSQAFQGGVTLTFREDETITLTPEQIRNMSERDLAKYWSNYVKELAVLLVAVEGSEDPPSQVVERIQELVQSELLFLYIRAALTNMQSVKKFIAKAKIEEVRVAVGPSSAPNRWREVSQALQLSPEQSQAVVALWHDFVEQVSKLLEQRRHIHNSISETTHDGCCGQQFAQTYLQAHGLMEQLKKNLRAEHVLIHEFLVNWYLGKLTTMQMARCFVKSYPFYPDIPAIAAWIAAGEHDPLALAKMPIMEAASPSSSS